MMRRITGAAVCLLAAFGIAALSAGTASAGVRITGAGSGSGSGTDSGQVTEWGMPASSIFGAGDDQTTLGRDF